MTSSNRPPPRPPAALSSGRGLFAGLALLASVAAGSTASGCATDAYCFVCDKGEAGVGGSGGATPDGAGGSGGTFCFTCDAGDGAPEAEAEAGCGDTQSAVNNCGFCGNTCNIFGANSKCVAGQCEIDTCADGFVDLDPLVPGCECTITASGTELCDAIDNNCDGAIDEGFDLQTDIDNCGACNNPCPDLPHSTKSCVTGQCTYTCDSGFANPGGGQTSGCLYQCPVFPTTAEACNGQDDDCDGAIDNGFPGAGVSCSDNCPAPDPCVAAGNCAEAVSAEVNGCYGECLSGQTACTGAGSGVSCVQDTDCPAGETCLSNKCAAGLICIGGVPPAGEICDHADNDCNGRIDEGFDFQTDELNCGDCGVRCAVGNSCVNGLCNYLPCPTGFKDIDGDPSNKCEYSCPVSPPTGPETCDGEDDDCDGVIDGTLAGGKPATCALDSDCAGTQTCVAPAGSSIKVCTCAATSDCTGTDECIGLTGTTNKVCANRSTDVGGTCSVGCPTPDPCVNTSCAPYAIAPNTGACYGACSTPGQQVCLGGNLVCTHPTQALVETCNGIDDTCDGRVDDGFDLTADPFNCGACGNVCTRPFTLAMTCVASACTDIVACQPGHADIDGNPANGCEYACPVDPPIGETCNGVDDDCDGTKDNFISGLGQSCTKVQPSDCPAPDPCVTAGNCTETLSTQTNGCYGVCENDGVTTCTSGATVCNHPTLAVETCNNQDDDCDGRIDDGFNTQTDVNNCGNCGHICSLPNTLTHVCIAGVCNETVCDPGFASVDGNPANGCEYLCPVTPAVAETCNGKDDDCDGLIDDTPSGVGVACQTNCPGNVCRGVCTPGTTSCVGGALACACVGAGCVFPSLEVCDTKDNDCNGTVDDGFAVATDPNNCGSCGHKCSDGGPTGTGPNATPGCAGGLCTILGCVGQFGNPNGTVSDGCEQACELPTISTEVCDGKDNDCDGKVDGADPSMQAASFGCVQTGPCAGSAPACTVAGNCPGGTSSCWRCNYTTINPNIQVQASGAVAVSETLCDGFDNNCNGQADEAFANVFPAPKACSVGVGECAGTGVYQCTVDKLSTVCPATAQPANAIDELCDGKDNNCDGQVDERNPIGALTCTNGGAHACLGWRDSMVNVGGGIFMYTYEASRADASATSLGTLGARACSNVNVLPWTSATFAQASAACAGVKDSTGASMRLCHEAEWQSGCLAGNSGIVPTWSYGTTPTTYAAGRCNDDNAATVVGSWATGSSAQCFSEWNAAGKLFDMSGNVSEWTDTCITLNGKNYCRARGGNSQTLAAGTTCTFSFVLEQDTFANFDLGFRCCSANAP